MSAPVPLDGQAEVVPAGVPGALVDGTGIEGDVLDGVAVVFMILAALADRWDEEADQRRKGAERSDLFGPRMMILSAEGSVMAACATELRDAIRAAVEAAAAEGL